MEKINIHEQINLRSRMPNDVHRITCCVPKGYDISLYTCMLDSPLQCDLISLSQYTKEQVFKLKF